MPKSEVLPAAVIHVEAERPLAELAAVANEHHLMMEEASQRAQGAIHDGIDNALKAGQALNEAKKRLGHGKWADWLNAHVAFTDRTARKYMKLDRERERLGSNRNRGSDLSIRQALSLLEDVSEKPEPEEESPSSSGQAANPDTQGPDQGQASSGASGDHEGSPDGDGQPEGQAGEAAPAEPPPPPPAKKDAWGIPVQPHAAEAFAASPKFQELVNTIQSAQRLFNELANSPGGRFLTLPDVSSYRRGKKLPDGSHADRFVHEGLERAYQQVKAAAPAHTVCPWNYVDGAHPADCRTCLGLNWTPALGSNVPESAASRAKEAHGV